MKDVPQTKDEQSIKQGWRVLVCGVLGIGCALMPGIILFCPPPINVNMKILASISAIIWAALVGLPITRWWSCALHEQVDKFRDQLDEHKKLTPEDKEQYANNTMPWIQPWIGVLERTLFVLLIGLSVPDAGSFVILWMVLKLASGWVAWTRGSRYGHSIFHVSLLGNAMSALFGVVSGLVLREYLSYP